MAQGRNRGRTLGCAVWRARRGMRPASVGRTCFAGTDRGTAVARVQRSLRSKWWQLPWLALLCADGHPSGCKPLGKRSDSDGRSTSQQRKVVPTHQWGCPTFRGGLAPCNCSMKCQDESKFIQAKSVCHKARSGAKECPQTADHVRETQYFRGDLW